MPATLTRRPPPWSPWRPRADGAQAATRSGRDYEYIEVTITGLHYDTGTAGPVSPAPEGRPDEGSGLRGH
jgi:hypothetical protein